jgi:predicted Rossmann fold flavoprotein
MQKTDVVIVGAGAAGLMCAIEAGKRGRNVLVLDQANKPGKKILMSGGGRCNFVNLYAEPSCYHSHNPHFCKSALSRYTQWDFIELVKKHEIPFHEKTLGQLFCDNKSKDILEMLLVECQQAGVRIQLNTAIKSVQQRGEQDFKITTEQGELTCESLVVATGGLSIPTLGASPFAYKLAKQFGLNVWPTSAGLVPFTLHVKDKERFTELSGVSVAAEVSNQRISFKENILFTHRGLSGPAILQISSYWRPGEAVTINLLPEFDLFEKLKLAQQEQANKLLKNYLNELLPKRLVTVWLIEKEAETKLADFKHLQLKEIAERFKQWQLKPNATEGYRTAEVTLGGVDCDEVSSKTMEAKSVKGLYFIGECLDVTGWLGGYNFQWAWSSGWAAGQVC